MLTGVTPGGEYKVARTAEPRDGAGWYESDNYYVQPMWGGGYYRRSFGGPYYNGSRGYYRPPPRGY